jgi:hypothetical protein
MILLLMMMLIKMVMMYSFTIASLQVASFYIE